MTDRQNLVAYLKILPVDPKDLNAGHPRENE
jgi:hypothetical protein